MQVAKAGEMWSNAAMQTGNGLCLCDAAIFNFLWLRKVKVDEALSSMVRQPPRPHKSVFIVVVDLCEYSIVAVGFACVVYYFLQMIRCHGRKALAAFPFANRETVNRKDEPPN